MMWWWNGCILRSRSRQPPVTEPEKTFEEVLDEHPVSIQVNGQWQTFPNAKAAEEASYEEYKANLAPQCTKLPYYR